MKTLRADENVALATAAPQAQSLLAPVELFDLQHLLDVERPDTTISVGEVNSRAAFMQLAGEWNALVRATRDQPFYRHETIRIWLDNFAPQARIRVLTGRNSRGRLVAALPLVEDRTSLLGAPVRRLVSAANDHSPRFDLIAENGVLAGQAFFNYLEGDNSWDMLLIKAVPHAGHAWRLLDAAAGAGCPTSRWEAMHSPYFALPATPDEMHKRLDARFKANLRRRRKKLAEKGCVTVERTEGGMELPFRLEEGFRLEQSGWKGRAGTAIAQSSQTWGFYSELAHFAAQDGSLALATMRVDGRPVAFHYGLNYRGTYYLLKPAYEEAVKECSPGQLLVDEVMSRCIEASMEEFDFLGPDMPWKRDWTDTSRRHTWLYLFRDTTYGRFLHDYRFRWARRVKQIVGCQSKA